MRLVVDSSVAVKWVVDENGRDEALKILEFEELVAPDFLLVEAANVFWKKSRRGEVTVVQSQRGLDFIRSAFMELVPQTLIVKRAVELAGEFDHPVYDCLYVACAEINNADLVTADQRFADKFASRGVRRLG